MASPRPGRSPRAQWLLIGCALVVGLSAGCETETTSPRPAESTKYTLENTDRFQYLDQPAQRAVTCTGLWEHALADGRLEVVANLKNRANGRVAIQASCAFKDEQGGLIADETPWQNVTLAENETQAVRFAAKYAAAKQYTVRVRESR